MQEITQLMQQILNYLESLSSTPTTFEFIATTISPIVSTIAVVGGGGFALYKYYVGKNYDINLKILNEVYLPLYSYLVKQETFRYIACPEKTWEEYPILEIRTTKTKQTLSSTGLTTEQVTEGICGCTKDALLKISEQTNMGLASTELVSLLNIYMMTSYITSGNINSNEKAKAAILQEKTELALRKEILEGYKYYHKKLKLHKSHSDIYSLSSKQIEFLPTISQEEIDQVKGELDKIES